MLGKRAHTSISKVLGQSFPASVATVWPERNIIGKFVITLAGASALLRMYLHSSQDTFASPSKPPTVAGSDSVLQLVAVRAFQEPHAEPRVWEAEYGERCVEIG